MFNEIKPSQAQLDKQFASPILEAKQKRIENLLVDLENIFFCFKFNFGKNIKFLAQKSLGSL